jgi:hypothetical protein
MGVLIGSSTYERYEKSAQNFGLKAEEKILRESSRHKWEDNIKINFQEIR